MIEMSMDQFRYKVLMVVKKSIKVIILIIFIILSITGLWTMHDIFKEAPNKVFSNQAFALINNAPDRVFVSKIEMDGSYDVWLGRDPAILTKIDHQEGKAYYEFFYRKELENSYDGVQILVTVKSAENGRSINITKKISGSIEYPASCVVIIEVDRGPKGKITTCPKRLPIMRTESDQVDEN